MIGDRKTLIYRNSKLPDFEITKICRVELGLNWVELSLPTVSYRGFIFIVKSFLCFKLVVGIVCTSLRPMVLC